MCVCIDTQTHAHIIIARIVNRNVINVLQLSTTDNCSALQRLFTLDSIITSAIAGVHIEQKQPMNNSKQEHDIHTQDERMKKKMFEFCIVCVDSTNNII